MAWTAYQDAAREDQITGVLGDDGTVTLTCLQTWVATTDGTGGTDGDPYSAMYSSGVPVLGSYVAIGSQAFKINNSVPKRIGPHTFEIRLQGVYKYSPPGDDKSNVTITIGASTYTQDAYYDKDDKPIVNSANQTFDPSVVATFYDEKIDVSYNTTSDQSGSFEEARGKVNSSDVSFNIKGISRSFDSRHLLCIDASTTDTLPLADGTPTYKVTLSFVNRSDGWQTKILDQGLYTLADDGKVTPALDDKGKPVTQPIMLDGDGNALADGDDPVYLTFKIQDEADFTSLFTGLS